MGKRFSSIASSIFLGFGEFGNMCSVCCSLVFEFHFGGSFWYMVFLFLAAQAPIKKTTQSPEERGGGIADFQHSIDIAKHTELKPNGVRNPPKTYEIEIRG